MMNILNNIGDVVYAAILALIGIGLVMLIRYAEDRNQCSRFEGDGSGDD